MHNNPHRLRELTPAESLRRLGSVPMGRLVFIMHALPTIRPVNHLLCGANVIIRCHTSSALLSAIGQVVAFEADSIDADTQAGWSVTATGKAWLVDDDAQLDRYTALLRPWVDGDEPRFVRIHPEIITGYELIEQDTAAASCQDGVQATPQDQARVGS